MRTISIIGYYGAGNLGDELLLQSTIQLLDGLGKFNLNIFSSNTELLQKQYPQFRHSSKFNIWHLLKGIANSKMVIFGGGSIFQDVSSFKSCFYYFMVSLTTKILGKKLILLGQGIGPFKSPVAKILSQYAMYIADRVSVRDTESFEFAKKLNSTTKLAPDLVWINKNSKNNSKEKRILISLRDKYLSSKQIQEFIKFLSKDEFLEYYFDLIALQSDDTNILQQLSEKLVNSQIHEIFSIDDWASQGESIFSKAEFSISMRLHALLLSTKNGCKNIGLAYDPKVKQLCLATNQPYVDLDKLDLESLNNCFLKAKSIDTAELMKLSEQYSELSIEINSQLLKEMIDR